MYVSESTVLTATLYPEGISGDIEWKSADENVLKITSDGNSATLKAVAVRSEDDEQGYSDTIVTAACNGKTAKCAVRVMSSDALSNDDAPKITDKDGKVIAIADKIWATGFKDSMEFTGNKVIQSDMKIYCSSKLLTEGKDYTLTYKNNVNAVDSKQLRSPSVTVTMKGQYSGKSTLYYAITQADVSGVYALSWPSLNYNKRVQQPVPTLYYMLSGKQVMLRKGRDYNVSYVDTQSKDPGRYAIKITGIGNYSGELDPEDEDDLYSCTRCYYEICSSNNNFAKATVKLDKKAYSYDDVINNSINIIYVKIGSKIIPLYSENDKQNTEPLYKCTTENDASGVWYAVIEPTDAGTKNGYAGQKRTRLSVSGEYKINETNLKIDTSDDEAWKDSIVFSQKTLNTEGGIFQGSHILLPHDGDTQDRAANAGCLIENTDYKIKYSGNLRAGRATAVITGIGHYSGTKRVTYTITPNTFTVKAPASVTYVKGKAAPTLDVTESGTGITLNPKTDYSVCYSYDKKRPDIVKCTVKGKGNYRGCVSNPYEVAINNSDISLLTMTVGDKAFAENSFKRNDRAWKSPVSIIDSNGKKLVAGTDYDKELIYTYPDWNTENKKYPEAGDTVYVTANGLGFYEGSSITGSYHIYQSSKTSINRLYVLIDDKEYTGNEIRLSENDIHVYDSRLSKMKGEKGKTFGKDYEIVGYSNNIKSGSAKVTLHGLGTYGGTRTYSFKITKKAYECKNVTGISFTDKGPFFGLPEEKIQIEAKVYPQNADNQTIVWTSSNTSVANVDSNGLVTAIKKGVVNITATTQEGGKRASCKVYVIDNPIAINPASTSGIKGSKITLSASINQSVLSKEKVTWTSSDDNIAAVDNGTVTLNNVGKATITASILNGKYTAESKICVWDPEDEDTCFNVTKYKTESNTWSTAIKSAITDASNAQELKPVYIPKGTYAIDIDGQCGIEMKDGVSLYMDSNAVLKANSANTTGLEHCVINIHDVKDVSVKGGQIIGSESVGDCHGVGIYDSTNVTIADIKISKNTQDGIYIGTNHPSAKGTFNSGIVVTGCNSSNNDRHGLAIVAADGVKISKCTFSSAPTNRTGLEIEPFAGYLPCRNITADSCVMQNNDFGFSIYGGNGTVGKVTLSNCTISGNKMYQILVYKATATVNGVTYSASNDDWSYLRSMRQRDPDKSEIPYLEEYFSYSSQNEMR